MTGNISYLSDFKPFDGGYVSFGQGGCKITGKGTIKTDLECIVLGRNFKLLDDECCRFLLPLILASSGNTLSVIDSSFYSGSMLSITELFTRP
nr:hypothetical protein [Tanacetum cinerariifolium]